MKSSLYFKPLLDNPSDFRYNEDLIKVATHNAYLEIFVTEAY